MTESERYIKRQTARRVILTAKGDLDRIIESCDTQEGYVTADADELERISQALDNAVNALIGT